MARFPLDNFSITQGFNSGHPANDLAAPQGTPIKAPEAGKIDGINNNPKGYFGGNYITLKGNSGQRYYMGHNSKNRVSLGQTVKEGQHIGDVGMTGQATGPHIHFQLWNKAGQLIDPSKVLRRSAAVAKLSTAQITKAYQDLLGRKPDAGGLKHYLASGFSDAQLRADLKGSAEYKKRQARIAADAKAKAAADAKAKADAAAKKAAEDAAKAKAAEEAAKQASTDKYGEENNNLLKQILALLKSVFNR